MPIQEFGALAEQDPQTSDAVQATALTIHQTICSTIPLLGSDFEISFTQGSATLNIKKTSNPAKDDIKNAEPCSVQADRKSGLQVPANCFHKFNLLPPVLRREIWEYSFSHPRVFCLLCTDDYCEEDMDYIPLVYSHRPPAAREACREAREISEQIGVFKFGAFGGRLKGLWFNLSADIVYLERSRSDGFDNESIKRVLKGVQILALDLCVACGCYERDWVVLLEDVQSTAPDCTKLILAEGYCEQAEGDVKFYSLRDEDRISYKKSSWGKTKRKIVSSWRSKRCMTRLEITVDDLPELQGAECVASRKELIEKAFIRKG